MLAFRNHGIALIGQLCDSPLENLTCASRVGLVTLLLVALACFSFPGDLSAATISYVQGNNAVPQSPQSTVTVTFTGAQAAGDLNVVVVGWNDSTAAVRTITDKSGNTYTRAVGPTVISGSASQSIYYAQNIVAAAAGVNAVTVTFSTAAPYPDIRILEYKGADPNNPVDVTVAQSGNSAGSSSGSVNITNANDLLLGANYVATGTTGAGSGFTGRMITQPDGDIVEDRMVSATGSYSATAPLSSSGWWIMQMVAFRTAAPSAITYVQGSYAVPQSPQSTVAVTFTGAQAAGDLNVIVVGWNDGTAAVSAITDHSGNTYTRMAGPTVISGSASQSIYYAKNIVAAAAGANTVMVTFSTAAQYPDVRILEYSGASPTSPVDATAALTGNSATTSSGSLTTTTINDLLLAANYVATGTTSPGAGFTSRMITQPDGDIVEDMAAAAPGSYSAAAPVSPSGWWVMQAVALRPASSGSVTPPKTPTNLTATAASMTQINLGWTASTSAIGIANYIVQRCQGAGCTSFAQIATPAGTSYSDTNLTPDTSYSYRVQAVDTAGNLSSFSSVASAATPADTQPPTAPTNLTATAASSSQINLSWSASTDNVAVTGYLVQRCQGAGCTSFAQIASPTGTTYSDTGLSPGASYTYKVQATDAAGNLSSSSSPATAVTQSSTGNIAFVQCNYATPQLPQSTVTVTFTGAQTAGDLNVIVVGWNDSIATVSAVTDHSGNTYTRAAGPTVISGSASQSIYYAKNIVAAAAGANAVKVTFSTAAQYPDVRILEYNGASPTSPVDVTAAQTGNSATTSSGSLTTTSVNDLLLAANYVATGTTSPGAGFTSRMITQPDGDIVEDMAATAPGSYTAAAPVSPAGFWIMQAVAFRPGPASSLSISPRAVALTFTRTQQFTANSTGVTWSVDGVAGGSTATGTITTAGLYAPPTAPGTHIVTATAGSLSASATIYITNDAGMFTHHNDNLRTGQNQSEMVLTPLNVNSVQFGKIFNYPLDGIIFASPLYVANVSVPNQGYHNIVYVATENDSVFALDADGRSSAPLWMRSFINPSAGITTVPVADTGETSDIPYQIGITGTPVIDATTNTLYVVAKTKEVTGGNTSYVHRLHALDIATGAEKFGGPVVIRGSVPGTGAGASGGHVAFNDLCENQRAALLLNNGIVYTAFGAHGDHGPWHGWVMGYNAGTLQQTMSYNVTPNSYGGGVWQSGGGLSADPTGNVYFTTGNGGFDVNTGGNDYGQSVEKLSPSGTVLDYFTPYDQLFLENNDLDPSSAGPALLVDQSGAHPHLLITAGKNGTVYVINRDNMGHYNSVSDGQVVQALVNELPSGSQDAGNFSCPVYFNGYVYFGAVSDQLKAFQLTNGLLSSAPTSRSAVTYGNRGATFAVSANGTGSGILWAIQDNAPNPGVLRAYDATNLANELYNSSEAAGNRDSPGTASKFVIPLIANGKVYVAAQTQLVIYSLLP